MLGRYVGPVIISDQTRYSYVGISVGFIKGRPTSNLELIFRVDDGVEHKSNKFKKSDLVRWTTNMFESLAMSCLTIG